MSTTPVALATSFASNSPTTQPAAIVGRRCRSTTSSIYLARVRTNDVASNPSTRTRRIATRATFEVVRARYVPTVAMWTQLTSRAPTERNHATTTTTTTTVTTTTTSQSHDDRPIHGTSYIERETSPHTVTRARHRSQCETRALRATFATQSRSLDARHNKRTHYVPIYGIRNPTLKDRPRRERERDDDDDGGVCVACSGVCARVVCVCARARWLWWWWWWWW